MKPRPRPSLSRLGLSTLASLTCLVPASLMAESTVFQTTFATDTIHAETPVISPTSTNWYVLSSKNATTSSVSGTGGLNLTYSPGSTAAGVQGVARFSNSALVLDEVGESITARAVFYTDNVRNLAVGLFDSGGSDPLTTLINTGLVSTPLTVSTGGTLAWKGYRGRLETGSTSSSLIARKPQTGAILTQLSYDVVAANTGDFNSPAPLSIGSTPASTSAVTLADGYGAEYTLVFTITRSAANAFSISYTITDSSANVLYSVSGTTTNEGALPSDLSSAFDAIGFGTRNNAASGSNVSTLTLTAVTITASNSDIARIVHQPINQTWVPGTPGTISVTAAGTGTLGYQWYKGTDPIPSATSATYTVASPSAVNDNGDYRVVVTNAYGHETSSTVSVDVTSAAAPAITTPPASQTVNEGEPLSLSVVATGAPTPTYQWYKDTGSGFQIIPDATYPTYTIANTVAADAASYHVVATNSQNTATSATAVVTIHSAPPAIVTPPADVIVNVGSGIVLSATASGYPAPSYQWYKNTGSGFEVIPGATGATYTIASATTPNAGTYHVVASNYLDTVTSAAATVTVNVVAPTITTEPSNATVALGQPASFTVASDGSLPLTYQWYKNTGSGFEIIPDATSATYTIPTTTGSSAGEYRVVVNNESNAPVTSATATLSLVVTETTSVLNTNFAGDTINPTTPVITPTSTAWYMLSTKNARNCTVGDDPATTDVVEARPLTIALEAGSGSAFFQTATRFSDSPVNLTQIGSQLRVTTTFTTQNIRTLGFGLYNSGGSWPKQLDFDDTSLAASERTVLGSAGTTAVGSGTQGWIGYRGTVSELVGTANVGQIIFTRPAQTAATTNQGQELCVNGSGTVSYNTPTGVSILASGSPTRFPSSDAPGAMTDNTVFTLVFTISRSAADQFTIGHEIYQGVGTGGTLFRSATAVTSAATALPSAMTQGFDAFAIGMRNAGPQTGPIPNFVFSNFKVEQSVPVTAVTPTITDQPESVTVADGAPFTLTAAAAGSPTPTYQWWKNTGSGFAIIPDATSASYTVGSASAADAATYKFVATNAVGVAESDVVTVTVGSAASAYDTWASATGLTVANNGPTQDPDNDGVNNLLEFALGGDPLASSTSILPVAVKNGSNLTFTFNVEVAATVDYIIGTESTTDLTTTWTPVVHGVNGATIVETPVDADTDQVVVTVPATDARLFLRVEVAPKP